MYTIFGIVLAVVGISAFAWSWSKMPDIMDDWTDDKKNE